MKKQVAKIKLRFRFGEGCRRHRPYIDLEVLSRGHLHAWPVGPLADILTDLVFQCAVVGLKGFAEAVLKRRSLCQGSQQLNELRSSFSFGAKDQVVHKGPRFGI